MPDDLRVDQLLEDLLDSGGTPEEACRTCPELLPQVRAGWQRFAWGTGDLLNPTDNLNPIDFSRSEERRVGKEC